MIWLKTNYTDIKSGVIDRYTLEFSDCHKTNRRIMPAFCVEKRNTKA